MDFYCVMIGGVAGLVYNCFWWCVFVNMCDCVFVNMCDRVVVLGEIVFLGERVSLCIYVSILYVFFVFDFVFFIFVCW